MKKLKDGSLDTKLSIQVPSALELANLLGGGVRGLGKECYQSHKTFVKRDCTRFITSHIEHYYVHLFATDPQSYDIITLQFQWEKLKKRCIS